MTRPLPSGKQSVNLGSAPVAAGPRVSKIRRDPPPPVKQKSLRIPDENNRFDAVVGIVAFALAMFVILFAFASYSGWSPAQYSVTIEL